MSEPTSLERLAARRATLVAEAARQRAAFATGRGTLGRAPLSLLSALPYVDTGLRLWRMLRSHPTLACVALAMALFKRVSPGADDPAP